MKIAHNRPLITEQDRAAVDEVLNSGWIAQGPEVQTLESSFVCMYKSGAAAALSSGTAALFLALRSLGLRSGAKIAVPTYACSALLNAIFQLEAIPVIVDVTVDTFCIDPTLPELRGVDAVIAVNTFGAQVGLQTLREEGRKIIEDCCHSLGAELVHGSESADAVIFSFYATKLITGGQGGLVWSPHKQLIQEVQDYREFDCREYYKPRFNFQMTDIQAALINSQMRRLQQIRAYRHQVSSLYRDALPKEIEVQSGVTDPSRMPYRFVIKAPNIMVRDALKEHLNCAGIEAVIPIERYELLHRYMKLNPEEFPVAERLVDITLSLPVHTGLTKFEVASVVDAIKDFKIPSS